MATIIQGGTVALTVYGIPSCSTVARARKWLEARSVDYSWVDFRASPVARDRVEAWVEALGAKALKNTSGRAYRALGDEKKRWTDAQWVEAFSADPMLVKRPVIERDGTAVQVGFRGTDDEIAARLL